MTLRHLVLAAASALAVASCATSTPFQPASAPGAFDGYSQQLIENDRARVTFGGNSMTDRETVETYLLYRTAELALERGFDHFTLVERDTEEDVDTRVRRSPGVGFGYGGPAFGPRFAYRPGLYDPYFDYSFFRPRVGWSRGYRMSRFDRFSRFGYSPYNRFGYDPFFNDYDVREVSKYRATAEAVFGSGPAPDRPNAFDAREVIENLGPEIDFPES